MNFFFLRLLPGFLCLFFLQERICAQTNRIDIYRTAFNKATSGEEKKSAVLNICDQYYSLSSDSLLKYVTIGQQLFDRKENGFLRLKNFQCIVLFKNGKITEGLAIGDSLIHDALTKKNKDHDLLDIMAIHSGGLIRNDQSKEAIKEAFDMLSYAEPLKDTVAILKAYTLLGWAYMELEQYPVAIKWLNKATSYSGNRDLIARNCVAYSNNASCYNNIGKADSAFYFIKLALKYSREIENLTCLANSLNIRADMFINKNDNIRAESDMKEALEVRQHIGEPMMIISDMAQLSFFYASTGQTNKGIEVAKEGIALAQNMNSINKLIFLYSALGENYRKSNQLAFYNNTLERIITLKDSLYKKNSGDAIGEMEAKYNLQRQQNIIITQDYALTRSRYVSIGSSVLFLLGLVLVLGLYRNYRSLQGRKMTFAYEEQKSLSLKAIEIAKENERKRIAADLHDNLGSYAAAITANVNFLYRKHGAKEDANLTQLEENAQSMVTQLSDTIWVLKNEHLPFTVLADRFKAWLLRLMQNYPAIRYNYSESIENDIEFRPEPILNIFLILKECINNSVKHSSCSAITIEFYSRESWRISIEDNGKGFDAVQFSRGSGVSNIKNRAAASQWNVEWQKAEPSGTRVVISGQNV